MREGERCAGVLCHISSLPGKYGIGSLGKEAYEFCDFLHKAHVRYWQILPLCQTGYCDSPYQSVYCNSGNPYFIDLYDLYERGLLKADEVKLCETKEGDVNYGALYGTRFAILRKAFSRFNVKSRDFSAFVERGDFENYALFMSLKAVYPTLVSFPKEYKERDIDAIMAFKKSNESEYLFWQFLQYIFFDQWGKLKRYANGLGIKIIGDLPLYVAADSADVWANPDLFVLDDEYRPTLAAGVPPDYFSKTGQLWGNPLYDWDKMKEDGYSWWRERLERASECYDVVRLDHFRGLYNYYAIPASSHTAENGEWRMGPGEDFFESLSDAFSRIDVIAEDLGISDEGVEDLRKKAGLPGMKIVLFGLEDEKGNENDPVLIEEDTVTYTGTHDNDTALGYINTLTTAQFADFKRRLRETLKEQGFEYPMGTRHETAYALNACALQTKSRLAVLPIQDVLCLGGECRMNTPSVMEGNWRFRLRSMPPRADAAYLRALVNKTGRD